MDGQARVWGENFGLERVTEFQVRPGPFSYFLFSYGSDPASRSKFRQPDFFLGSKGISRVRDFAQGRPIWDVFGSQATSAWADRYSALDEPSDDPRVILGADPWNSVSNQRGRRESRFILTPKFQLSSVLNILETKGPSDTILAFTADLIGVVENRIQVAACRKLAMASEEKIFNKKSTDVWMLALIRGSSLVKNPMKRKFASVQ